MGARNNGSEFYARGFSVGIRLTLSDKIQHEWQVRSIGGVIPALDGYSGERTVYVDHGVAREIVADCEFYADPKAIDATAGERRAYKALRDSVLTALEAA